MKTGRIQYESARMRQETQACGRAPTSGNIGAGKLAWTMLISLAWAILTSAGALIAVNGAAYAAGPVPGGQVFSLANPEHVSRVAVTVNKSQTVRVDHPFAEALVGNSEIADVIPLTDRTLYILGKEIGGTRISILDKDKKLLGVMEIEVSYDADAIHAQFKKSMPRSQIKVTPVNGKILLTGFVPDAIELEKAMAIASQYAPESVTNSLSVAGSQQVLLEVRFVEASRNATRNLGVNWRAVAQSAGNFALNTNLPGTIGLGAFPATTLPFGSMVTRLLSNGVNADLIIQALEEKGLARRLAEPNLVALSGDTASFLAGGEFPFPIARQDDTITIEFKKFGVGLGFTPTVLGNGLINLKIEPEVSEIDPNNTLVVNDTTIPGLVTRRAKTTVELRDGQSFAIAGLLQSNHSKSSRQLPWIGQVPVLGALFRSASYERNETDLVIIVTPRLVKPAAPGQPLITPFDKTAPSNDAEFFLNGKTERPSWRAHVARTRHAHPKKVPPAGHMLGAGGPVAETPGSYKDTYSRSYKESALRSSDLITGSLPKKDDTPDQPAAALPAAEGLDAELERGGA